MLNPAWPNLHWAQFDYYMNPLATYFGTKVGTRTEHVAYDYNTGDIYVINHSTDKKGSRTVLLDLIDATGKSLAQDEVQAETAPTSSKQVAKVPALDTVQTIAFLRLVLQDESDDVLSRNVYWLPKKIDVLNWDDSTWWNTPVTEYATYGEGLKELSAAEVKTTVNAGPNSEASDFEASVTLENGSDVPAFFIQLTAVQGEEEVSPVYFSDNYVTLWPQESLEISVKFSKDRCDGTVLEVLGYNVDTASIDMC